MNKKPRRGVTLIAVGATHGIKRPKRVLAGFLPEGSKNHDKTNNQVFNKLQIINT